MIVDEMVSEIRSRMNITSEIITDMEILRSLNDGYKDVACKALCIEQIQSGDLTNERYFWLSGIKMTKLTSYYGLWEYSQYWFQWGTFLVVESVSPYQHIYYVSRFVAILPESAMLYCTDGPYDLPYEFRHLIVDFALYVLSLKRKKWRDVSIYYNIYVRNLKKVTKEYMERKAEKRTIHQLPNNVRYKGGKAWAH